MGRLIGIVVVILVLYTVISQPRDSASMTRNGVSQLGAAGDQLVVFVMALLPGDDGQVRTVPSGGVATGDGSTET